jgi:nucleotide-binding universal stress UspA family protein
LKPGGSEGGWKGLEYDRWAAMDDARATQPHVFDRIVCGIDAAAYTVAHSLAKRLGGSARAVASMRDHFDREAAQEITPDLEEQPGHAVEVLAAASKSADLIVVGSRGLHGLKALGSVSERIAHEAHSSVLAVRDGRSS